MLKTHFWKNTVVFIGKNLTDTLLINLDICYYA